MDGESLERESVDRARAHALYIMSLAAACWVVSEAKEKYFQRIVEMEWFLQWFVFNLVSAWKLRFCWCGEAFHLVFASTWTVVD